LGKVQSFGQHSVSGPGSVHLARQSRLPAAQASNAIPAADTAAGHSGGKMHARSGTLATAAQSSVALAQSARQLLQLACVPEPGMYAGMISRLEGKPPKSDAQTLYCLLVLYAEAAAPKPGKFILTALKIKLASDRNKVRAL
jgi:hypothetical protein